MLMPFEEVESLFCLFVLCAGAISSESPAPPKARQKDHEARKAPESRRRRSPEHRGRGHEEISPRHHVCDGVRLHCHYWLTTAEALLLNSQCFFLPFRRGPTCKKKPKRCLAGGDTTLLRYLLHHRWIGKERRQKEGGQGVKTMRAGGAPGAEMWRKGDDPPVVRRTG